MAMSRRDAMRVMGASAAVSLTGWNSLSAASPPTTPLPRMPLDEFVDDARLLKALRKGVAAMKRRKPSDPLSWFYQAAIHGVTDEAIEEAAKDDPSVDNVFQRRYWNQCPHFGQESANFLPWHRGYTYYFEKILRLHAEEDDFSLPYWDYKKKTNRKFPREFGIQYLDGDPANNAPENINPLFLAERDYYFCRYEHPIATGLPLLELTDEAVDDSLSMNAPVFFGATEQAGLGGAVLDEDPSTRGLLESYPHDHIHRAVGGIVISPAGTVAMGAMATPPTAGFDPIFSIHHCNIDRLWAEWSCMKGKRWGTLPSKYWFDERAWFFFDENGQAINRPRQDYFDYRALGVRFKYEDPNCQPLVLPPLEAEQGLLVARQVSRLAETKAPLAFLSATRGVVPLSQLTKDRLRGPVNAIKAAADGRRERLLLRLMHVDLGAIQATGFEVHVTANANAELSRNDASFVGSINMFTHAHHHGGPSETFDISRAVAALGDGGLDRLSVVIVPYALLTVPGKSATFLNAIEPLKVGGVEFLEDR